MTKQAKGTMLNKGRIDNSPAVRYEDMSPLQQAKADMDYARRKGGNAYRQAKPVTRSF